MKNVINLQLYLLVSASCCVGFVFEKYRSPLIRSGKGQELCDRSGSLEKVGENVILKKSCSLQFQHIWLKFFLLSFVSTKFMIASYTDMSSFYTVETL